MKYSKTVRQHFLYANCCICHEIYLARDSDSQGRMCTVGLTVDKNLPEIQIRKATCAPLECLANYCCVRFRTVMELVFGCALLFFVVLPY